MCMLTTSKALVSMSVACSSITNFCSWASPLCRSASSVACSHSLFQVDKPAGDASKKNVSKCNSVYFLLKNNVFIFIVLRFYLYALPVYAVSVYFNHCGQFYIFIGLLFCHNCHGLINISINVNLVGASRKNGCALC